MLHKKEFSTSCCDFAFELRNFFEEWVQYLKVFNFEELKELIITDQIK